MAIHKPNIRITMSVSVCESVYLYCNGMRCQAIVVCHLLCSRLPFNFIWVDFSVYIESHTNTDTACLRMSVFLFILLLLCVVFFFGSSLFVERIHKPAKQARMKRSGDGESVATTTPPSIAMYSWHGVL